MSIFYCPPTENGGGVAADFIPFYWQGEYHIFYLRDYRNAEKHGEGTPWFHLSTRDFVNFTDHGEAIPRGPVGSQDQWIFTGSVFESAGVFHIFYTGHNRNLKDRPIEGVMHATSSDLKNWTKDPDFFLRAPAEYEPNDWRDPFIFKDERSGKFQMLLAARRTSGPARNRGCTALLSSPDLARWTVEQPFWSPDAYFTHECPDYFRSGDWHYLVYSEFSEGCLTRYRVSRSIDGPWRTPPGADGGESFDARAYYAAKTASDGRQRFAFGWLPTRNGDKDDGHFQWGGNLVVHEVEQHPDGLLTVRAPRAVLASFNRELPLNSATKLGEWRSDGRSVSTRSEGKQSLLTLGAMPGECLLETTLKLDSASRAGVLLRVDEKAETYYQLRVEPQRQRVVIDRWPRPGDQPFMLERPVALPPGAPVKLQLIAAGTCLVAYINDRVALSCRMYDHAAGEWGVCVDDGHAEFSECSMRIQAGNSL